MPRVVEWTSGSEEKSSRVNYLLFLEKKEEKRLTANQKIGSFPFGASLCLSLDAVGPCFFDDRDRTRENQREINIMKDVDLKH